MADKYNKKHIIVTFDLIRKQPVFCLRCIANVHDDTVFTGDCFFISGNGAAGLRLIVDLIPTGIGKRAYSLNYLSMNLGLVCALTIGGIFITII